MLVPSRYNVSLDHGCGGTAVFNTYTCALVVLSRDQWQRYLAAGTITSLPDATHDNAIATLAERGFLVPAALDELARMNRALERGRHDSRGFRATVSLTMRCNLRCPYCYEGSGRAASAGTPEMTVGTANAILRFLAGKAAGKQYLNISWLGGEPLLATALLDRSAEVLQPALRQKGIAYSASLITNGMLLKETVFPKLSTWGITEIQVSVDVPQTYRYNRAGKPTRDRVLDNLSALTRQPQQVSVNLRINICHDDDCDFDALCAGLIERQLDKRLAGIYLAAINWDFARCGQCLPQNGNDTTSQAAQLACHRYKMRAVELGLPVSLLPSARLGCCVANAVDGVVIGHDGTLYKCLNDVGHADRGFGSVHRADDIRWENLQPWLDYSWTSRSECRECELFPLCAGDCPHKSLFGRTLTGCAEQPGCRQLRRRHLENLIYQTLALHPLESNLPTA